MNKHDFVVKVNLIFRNKVQLFFICGQRQISQHKHWVLDGALKELNKY